MRVLVVGGSGHIGRRITTELRTNPGFDVAVGGRHADRYENGRHIRVDKRTTFSAADDFDVVINCTDSGKIVEAAPIGKPQSVSFLEGLRSGFEIGLPEPFLFHKSLQAQQSSAIISTRPALPQPMILMTHLSTRFGVFRFRLVQAILRFTFGTIRVSILKNRSTALEMTAVALDSCNLSSPVTLHVRCCDAFLAAAEVVRSCLARLAERPRTAPGIYTADQLFDLEEVVEDCGSISIQRQSTCAEEI